MNVNHHDQTEQNRAANRLSGFFTSLIHRQPRPAQTETDPDTSRPETPPVRPATPPPTLPPPSLHELGLSLSVITSDLAPSHFSTPPTSGAFLAPHYLLLCHAQGLDVLPLTSPPVPQPYALVRRVCFKSVVVMEQRGVLVAIAGRRDGVRVYALEEVKKAVEWRMDVEIRRERERTRRENLKNDRDSQDKVRKPSLSTPPPGDSSKLLRKGSHPNIPIPPLPQLVPRTPTTRPDPPAEHPPPYDSRPPARPRTNSVADMLTTAPLARRNNERTHDPDAKADWVQSSDDEAIDIVAAGSSGSQALDERTSAIQSPPPPPLPPPPPPPAPPSSPDLTSSASTPTSQIPPAATSSATPSRRPRPATLDLSITSTSIPPPEPSPAPTLLTLRQALSHSPEANSQPVDEDEDEPGGGEISLAQALMESRLPDLPPLGSRRPQQPILIVSSHPIATGEDEPSSPRTSETHVPVTSAENRPPVRRRRWSVLINQPSTPPASESNPLPSAPVTRERSTNRLSRSFSHRSSSATTLRQPSLSRENLTASPTSFTSPVPPLPDVSPSVPTSRSSRFIPRIISTALHSRRSEDRPPSSKGNESDASRKSGATPLTPHFPPPKLEYVKLPGTKGSLMIKAVETVKKSFLAILCGENGEKVELFAGTYRTALGLSRTFILPDSPRSLELQLQGDDLVEVFLVFSQNVFGLEPATVRVREVRIGRAERRAARRRAREMRAGESVLNNDSELQLAEEDTNVNVSIGVTVAVGSTVVATGTGPDGTRTPPPQTQDDSVEPDTATAEGSTTAEISSAVTHAEELVAIATAQMGPYTTFQQLSFSPNFPLASIADDYIIPPTYRDFLEYRMEHEPETTGSIQIDLAQVQFTPPGLPIPPQTSPPRWFYRDPKNVVHGPWKASLMQAWYKDGLLPPDLPVRREEDSEYMLLKDLRQQSVDPSHPFRSSAPPPASAQDTERPLLRPISLLEQPRHYGPPALFYSSRGGHSTTIVDARGRSVLKGRFLWSGEEQEGEIKPIGRMGDVRRLEAFDVKDRSVLVAMRQGGLEVVDLGDALLKPGDESRTVLPHFNPPPSNLNRRAPFVWKIGTPVAASPTSSTVLASKRGGQLSVKKLSSGPARSPVGKTEFNLGDEGDSRDEVLFLGRKDDDIYICERNHGAFRILRLGLDSA